MRSVLLLVTVFVLVSSPAHADTLERRPQHVIVPHQDTGDAPTLGPRHAPVTMDFFISFDSPRNMKAYNYLVKLSKRHPRRLRLVFRILVNSGLSKLAEATMEAHVQGRFEPFMAQLYRYYRRRSRLPTRRTKDILAICERADVDVERVRAAWRDQRYIDQFENNDLLRRRRRTPIRGLTLLVNGIPSSLRPSETTLTRLEQLYDRAYAKAKVKMHDGVALEDVYHLSLLEADAALRPIRINAGAVTGQTRSSKRAVLDDAPLIAAKAREGGHRIGPRDARVTIRLYCDFTPGVNACKNTKSSLDDVMHHYPGMVRVFFHHIIPDTLSDDKREQSLLFHAAAVCVDRQRQFDKFYDRVYPVLHARRRRARQSAAKRLNKIISKLDINVEEYTRCMDDPTTLEHVTGLIQAARDAGIKHSPTVIVGDRSYPGSKTRNEILYLVEVELMPGLLQRLAPDPAGSEDWLNELIQ